MKSFSRTIGMRTARVLVASAVFLPAGCSAASPVAPQRVSSASIVGNLAATDCPLVKEKAPIRNLGPGHPNALLPVYDPATCEQVGTVHDKFMGESLKRYVSEQYILRGVQPNTTFTAHLEIWFNDSTCQQSGQPFVQPSLSFTTNAQGNGRITLDVAAPGTPGSPIPPQATGLTHCFVYVFTAGSTQYRTPPTPAYEDVPGRPANR